MDAVPDWWLTKDGDGECLALFERHYSAQARNGKRRVAQFVGPGEKLVLRTASADALFVWRRFINDSGQTGINCAVFRNESPIKSSELIRQADAIADLAWPNRRHYTYVKASAVKSTNPGYCFIVAGWRKCGMTKSGLIVLERPEPPQEG